VANLIRYQLPEYPKVLDVGCGAGTLAGDLPPSVHYLGIDPSESDIGAARSVWGGGDVLFETRDMREFGPVGHWDAIVFSEVLSYLTQHRSPSLCQRAFTGGHSRHQHEERRKEPRELREEFQWIDGILWKPKEPLPPTRSASSESAHAISPACSKYGTSCEPAALTCHCIRAASS
jgi:cyclopropane fatty-acyl-phospholipid synthase-like methyltransferase